MKPTFKITVSSPEGGNTQDITGAIEERLIEVSVHDQIGMRNDRLTIHIDDRVTLDGGLITLPQKGFIFDVEMGYTPSAGHDNPYDGTESLGTFVLDEMELEKSERGRTVAITGHGLDMTANKLKEQHTTAFMFTTLGKVVDAVCKKSGMDAIVDLGRKEVPIARAYQICESDIFFLVRLGKQYGCTVKVQEGKVYFAPQDTIDELQDLVKEDITIDETDTTGFHYLTQGAGKFSSVTARYFDYDSADGSGYSTVTVDAPTEEGDKSDGPVAELQRLYANSTEASEAAQTRIDILARSLDTFSFNCYGNPLLLSGGTLDLTGFRPEIPTEWKIVKVVHSFTSGGYLCDVDCELPKSGYKHRKRTKKVRLGTKPLSTIPRAK